MLVTAGRHMVGTWARGHVGTWARGPQGNQEFGSRGAYLPLRRAGARGGELWAGCAGVGRGEGPGEAHRPAAGGLGLQVGAGWSGWAWVSSTPG